MKTKIISILTALAMVFTLAIVSTAASGTPTITVSDGTVNIGETIDVTVSLSNNPGIINMRLALTYDDSVFEIIAVKDSGVMGESIHTNDLTASPYVLYWSNGTSESDYSANGTVATVTFKVKSTATAGTYDIGITYDIEDAAIFNRALENSNFTVDDGEITVKGSEASVSDDDIVFIEKFNTTENPTGYTVLKTDTKIALIKSNSNTMTYTYNGSKFYYAENLGGYAMIVDDNSDISLDSIIAENTPTNAVIKYNGDLSGDGIAASGDAAMLSAMLRYPDGNYSDIARLAAYVCVDGDYNVTTADVLWILREAVGLN